MPEFYDLRNAKKLILLGVDSFDTEMKKLEESGMKEILYQLVHEVKVTVLGVCLGKQIIG